MRKISLLLYLVLLLLPASADLYMPTEYDSYQKSRTKDQVRAELDRVPEEERLETARRLLKKATRQAEETKEAYDKSPSDFTKMRMEQYRHRQALLQNYLDLKEPRIDRKAGILFGGLLLGAGILLGLKRFLGKSEA